jgi:hypothetical protein
VRTRPTWLLAAALAVVLTACGDDADPDGGEQAQRLQEQLAETEQDHDHAQRRIQELEAEVERLDDATSRADDEADEAPRETEPEPLRTPEGLLDQPRLHLGHGDLPDGYEPGTTGWSPFELPDEAATELDEAYEAPGEAAAALLAALEAPSLGQDTWEATARVLLDPEDEDQAQAVAISWGWADDAVIGRDVQAELSRTDDDRWALGSIEARHHCLRGVTDDDRCV